MEVEINSGFLTLFPGHDGRNLETCNHFPKRKGKGVTHTHTPPPDKLGSGKVWE